MITYVLERETMMRPEIDDRDRALIAERQKKRDARQGPRVGDFIIMKDGTMQRFSHAWNDGLQTTDGKYGSSFYLDRNGGSSFSGGLNPIVKFANIKERPDRDGDLGAFWMFHHDFATAHNGVYFQIPCRVFEQI